MASIHPYSERSPQTHDQNQTMAHLNKIDILSPDNLSNKSDSRQGTPDSVNSQHSNRSAKETTNKKRKRKENKIRRAQTHSSFRHALKGNSASRDEDRKELEKRRSHLQRTASSNNTPNSPHNDDSLYAALHRYKQRTSVSSANGVDERRAQQANHYNNNNNYSNNNNNYNNNNNNNSGYNGTHMSRRAHHARNHHNNKRGKHHRPANSANIDVKQTDHNSSHHNNHHHHHNGHHHGGNNHDGHGHGSGDSNQIRHSHSHEYENNHKHNGSKAAQFFNLFTFSKTRRGNMPQGYEKDIRLLNDLQLLKRLKRRIIGTIEKNCERKKAKVLKEGLKIVWDAEYKELKARLKISDMKAATLKQKLDTIDSLKRLSTMHDNDVSFFLCFVLFLSSCLFLFLFLFFVS